MVALLGADQHRRGRPGEVHAISAGVLGRLDDAALDQNRLAARGDPGVHYRDRLWQVWILAAIGNGVLGPADLDQIGPAGRAAEAVRVGQSVVAVERAE